MTEISRETVGRLKAIVIDVGDLEKAMEFWSSLTGYVFGPWATAQHRATVMPESGLRLILQQVPELKTSKTRVHLDIGVSDIEHALHQVETLGGSFVERVHTDTGGSFIICADPDDNEFCLIPA